MQEDVDLGASAVVWSLPERQKQGEDVFGDVQQNKYMFKKLMWSFQEIEKKY